MPRIVSIGYQERTIDTLIDDLRRHDVAALVDVRLTPVSRKKGFSKRQLSERLEAAGIAYIHEGELGNPRENRSAYRRGEPQAREAYRRRVEAAPEATSRILDLAETGAVAVMCFEHDPDECHREQVIQAVTARTAALDVIVV